MKRINTLLITAVFCCLILGIASAVSAADRDIKYESAYKLLELLDIKLPYSSEDINSEISKSEFVYLIVRALNTPADNQGSLQYFSDVKLDYWAHDEIIAAKDLKIISGHTNATFGIDDKVQYSTSGEIVMNALGFNMLKEYDYADRRFTSQYNELYKGIDSKKNITYRDAYVMIFNMLSSEYPEIASYGQRIQYEIKKPFIFKTHGMYIYEGRITANTITSLGIGGHPTGVGQIGIDDRIYDIDYPEINDYIGYNVRYYAKDDGYNTIVYAYPLYDNVVDEISLRDVYDCVADEYGVTLKYNDSDKISFPKNCDFIYNGLNTPFSTDLVKNGVDSSGKITIIRSQNGVFTVCLDVYETIVIGSISMAAEKIVGENGDVYSFDDENTVETVKVAIDGKPASFEDIVAGSVAELLLSKDKKIVKIFVTTFSVTGDITALSNDNVEINGVEYEISQYYKNVSSDLNRIYVGLNGEFKFNSFGEFVSVDTEKSIHSGIYAYLIKVAQEPGIDKKCVIKVVTTDAKMKIYELNDKVSINGRKKIAASAALNEPELSGTGAELRKMIYFETSNGKVSKIYTPMPDSEYITCDAGEKYRKYPGSHLFLTSTNDSSFPEFFMDASTIIMAVPEISAEDSVFDNEKNYGVLGLSHFKDWSSYTVEGYNFSDFNIAGIVLVKTTYTVNENGHERLVLVDRVGGVIKDGIEYNSVTVYENGQKKKYIFEDSEDMIYNGLTTTIKQGDIARIFADASGIAIGCQYIANVNSVSVTGTPVGKNDGNAYFIGYIADANDTHTRIKLGTQDSAPEYVVAGKVAPTVYINKNNVQSGSRGDILPGDLAVIRTRYSTAYDIIILRD